MFRKVVSPLIAAILLLWLLPVSAAASVEERQQAVVAVALAYFDKGHPVQYDGGTLVADIPRKDGGKTRSTNQEPPEYATKYETLYSVCSDFAHQVYWEAFHYQLSGSAGANWTGKLLAVPADDPKTVCRYEKSSGKDVQEELEKMFELAQPGDIFTGMKPEGGHTMVYLGKLSDGIDYFCHSFGAAYHENSGEDVREYKPDSPEIDKRYRTSNWADSNGGGVRLTKNGAAYVKRSYGKGNYNEINLIRPLNEMPENEYPIRPAAKYRVTHPRLTIDRVVEEHSRFRSLYPGEKITLTVTLGNRSKTEYTVPVTEKIPAGVKLLKTPDGATLSGGELRRTVTLGAKETKVLSVEYEVTAKRGERVVFEGGSVGDIPSNAIPLTVGGAKLNDEDLAKLTAIAMNDYDEVLRGVKDAELGNTVYRKILGLDVSLPDFDRVWENMTDPKTFSNGAVARVFREDPGAVRPEDRLAFSMLVPMFHGGKNVWNEWGHERCNEPLDLHVEPGDVIVRREVEGKRILLDTLVYLGNGKYLKTGFAQSAKRLVEEPELLRSLVFNAFYCLRPTLAYDDIHTLSVPAVEPTPWQPFEDVKPDDWFCPYVKELLLDGTVSGMTKTSFVPNGTLTNGQALKLIALAVGEPEPKQNGNHWASGYLALAKRKEWVSGVVKPDEPITRLALCRIAAKAKGLTAQPESNPFTDTNDKGVLALYRAGVVSGMTATTFAPENTLTRAQACKIIKLLRELP